MRISQLHKYLMTVKPERSVLIIGPPGIGKSVSVKEFAMEEARRLNKEFIEYDDSKFNEIVREPKRYYPFLDIRLTEHEPTDILGIPRDVDSAVAYKPLLWARAFSMVEAGLLFLDEITNINRPDQWSVSYKLILDRCAGFVRFSRGVRIIAAGNAPEHSAVANLPPAPLTSRFHVIYAEAPTLEEWSMWMDSHVPEWDKRVLAYLSHPGFKADFIVPPKEPETLEPYPCPRTWHWLAEELPRTPKEFVKEKVYGYIGKEVGSKFVAFINNPVPDPRELYANPSKFKELSVDSKYLATVACANYFLEKNIDEEKVVGLLDTIASVQADFIVLFALVARKKVPFIVSALKRREGPAWNTLKEIGTYMLSS